MNLLDSRISNSLIAWEQKLEKIVRRWLKLLTLLEIYGDASAHLFVKSLFRLFFRMLLTLLVFSDDKHADQSDQV